MAARYNTAPNDHRRRYLTTAELADAVGLHINTIRNYAHKYSGFGHRVGNAWRFPKSYVERLMNSESPQTIADYPDGKPSNEMPIFFRTQKQSLEKSN